MMIFRSPWILLLIPVVIVAFRWWLLRQEPASFRFSSASLFAGIEPTWKMRFAFIPMLLRGVALALFIVALSGPQTVLEESTLTTEGIDIVLAVDCSGSMAAEDFTINGQRINRLDVVKSVVQEFIAARHNDRIGFIAFSAKAYTVCPLTTDYNWLNINLGRVRLGMMKDGTAVGSAIASAVGRLKNSKAKSRIVILLTDGISNAGSIDPLTAAKAAQTLGIKVYTIGAGTKGVAPFPARDFFGQTVYQNIQIDIDEKTLQEISRLTGAQYFRATDTDSLRKVYKEIDGLEKTQIEEKGYKEYKELFVYFLAAGLMFLLLEILLSNTLFLRIP